MRVAAFNATPNTLTSIVGGSGAASATVMMSNDNSAGPSTWVFESPQQFNQYVYQPGVAYANLPSPPSVGTTQFCTNCVPTTASACSTNSPGSCMCKAGTGTPLPSMWAKYENFVGAGVGWYCH